jgi:hypothetical protein
MLSVVLVLLLLGCASLCHAALSPRIRVGALAEFVQLTKSSSPSAPTTSNATLDVARSLFNLEFDLQLVDVTFNSWQAPANLQQLLRFGGVDSLFVVRNALPSTAAADVGKFMSLCTVLGRAIAASTPFGSRAHVALEPEFNGNANTRSGGAAWASALRACADEIKRLAPGTLVGSGWLVSRTATLNEQLSEFRTLLTSGAFAVAGTASALDFLVAVWRFATPTSNTRRLNDLPCHIQTLARLTTSQLRLESVVLLDIVNPPSDAIWQAANVKLADDLRGMAAAQFFDGLRMIGLRSVVCASGASETTACGVRVDRAASGAGIENTFSIKGDTQAWRSWMLNEKSASREASLTGPVPRFSCGNIMPFKSGLVYLDALISWDSSAWGWVDQSTASLVHDFSSTENVHDGKMSLRARFDAGQTGQRLRFEYRSGWPLSPLQGADWTHLVFDIYAEGWAPTDLPLTVRVSDQRGAVALSTVASRLFGADAWQRIVIPRASLLTSLSDVADAITISTSAPPPRPIVLFIDRMAFDATSLPCDFEQPQLGCNPLVLAPDAPTPAPTVVARCGNGIVEGTEQCDGGACCANCALKPAGLPCNSARANDQCDLPDTCDGVSGGCADKTKAVGAACDDMDDRCTTNDRCRSNGKCAGDFVCPCSGSDALCEIDLDRCTQDKCGADNKCTSTPTFGGIMCDDRDPCTSNDVCDGQGNCRGKPGLCSKPTPRPPAVGPPANCKPGQTHLCTCQLPDDFCVPPLTCKEGICYRPALGTAKPCGFDDFGKVSGCPCEPPPSNFCKAPLRCDVATETCVGENESTAPTTAPQVTQASGSSATEIASSVVVSVLIGVALQRRAFSDAAR